MDEETAAKYISPDSIAYAANITAMLNAPYFRDNGMEPVLISQERVRVRMPVKDRDRNSNGFWHGGAICGVMDHCFAIITNIDGHAVGLSTYVQYYRPGRGDVIEAESTVMNRTRSIITVNVKAFDGGKTVAEGTFTAFRLQEVHG